MHGYGWLLLKSQRLGIQTRIMILNSSTLQSGGVFVAPVRRCDPSVTGVSQFVNVPMCGLFAGRVFNAGDVVTSYGGTLMPIKSCTDKTHSRRIPDSDWVLSGLEWARAIRAGTTELMITEQSKLPVAARSHIVPPRNYMKNGITCDLVYRTGIGYMANTSTTHSCNVTVNLLRLRRGSGYDDQTTVHPTGLPVVVLTAKWKILPNHEILCRYGWSKRKV